MPLYHRLKKIFKLKSSSGNYTIKEFISDDDWKETFEILSKSLIDIDEALKIFTNFFRPNFKRNETNKNNIEHKFESIILTQMEDKDFGVDFVPIKLCSCRFQFPTKFSASIVTNGRVLDLRKDKSLGGGIDILALHNNRLSVIELKDEGAENVKYVMRQAIVYAVFLNKLFKECPIWKEILCCQNIKGIDAVICMPTPSERSRKEEPEKGSSITYIDGDENAEMNLHYIYFKYNKEEDKIEIKESSYLDQ